MIERVLSLDISSKTGWALLLSSKEGFSLEAYGKVDKIAMPEGKYPTSFVDWAYLCFNEIEKLIEELRPDVLVIEETSSGSKSSHSQKILEWIHFLLAKFIKETNIRNVYVMTEEWRRATGCKMTKEESKHNKSVRNYKKKTGSNIAYNESGKRVGILSRKHINIRRANEVFGKFLKEPLRKKNEDESDAILIGYSYYLKVYEKKI